MRIPKTFQIAGHTIKVIPEDNVNRWGACCREEKWIKIGNYTNIPRSSKEHTFCHELVHMLLYSTEHPELSDDEKFVDCFAGLLHQALVTQKGDFL